jgi:hypothetical protein
MKLRLVAAIRVLAARSVAVVGCLVALSCVHSCGGLWASALAVALRRAEAGDPRARSPCPPSRPFGATVGAMP